MSLLLVVDPPQRDYLSATIKHLLEQSHNTTMMNQLIILLASSLYLVAAFVPSTHSSRPVSVLFEVIRADVIEQEVDPGLGGVRLAQESSIKISGEVRHKPGSAESRALDLTRYTRLTPVEESKVLDILGRLGGKILATGQGKELHKNPGESIEAVVQLAPLEAIKDAVNSAASAIEEQMIVFNFLGGDQLMIGQVLDATNEAVVNMDIATKAKVFFNSMSDSSIPAGTCMVSVVSLRDHEESFSGADEAIAAGEVYEFGGKWFTVDKANINTAIA
jgi:hypothetical protein